MEEKLAIEAVKPAAGFIDALLGPKIQKLRLWAEERELKGKLDADILATVMERYLIKLSERVSEITSIAFPQLKLSIFDAYEPLALRELLFNSSQRPTEYNIDKLASSNKRTYIIIDDAGMGKSTFSKFVVGKLLFKSNRIPILFELRKLNSEVSLIENLAAEFDFPGKVFDRELFYKLLEMGKFYVILDGFDEIQYEKQQNLANQIYDLSVKGGDNNLLLTSRPQDALPELINSTSLRFIPFTMDQASSLLSRYDAISKLDVGSRLIKEIDSVPEKFIESPLLVSLLYRTFGVNNSIANRISTFYDEIYQALYKGHDLINKNGYSRDKKSGLDFEDFRKLLRSLCHYMMLNRKTSFQNWSEAVNFIDKAVSISSVRPTSSSMFLDDLLVAVPLMHKDGTEYKFLHKTILEYFSAEYLVFDKSSYALVEKIFSSKLAGSFSKVFDFLHDLNPSLFDLVITYFFAHQAPPISKNEDEFTLVEKTLTFIKTSKIGLWKTIEYSEPLPKSAQVVLATSCHEEGGFNSTVWRHGKIGNEEYMLAINHSDRPENLHPLAWSKISKPLKYDGSLDHEKSFDLKGFKEVLGEGTWVDVNLDLLAKLPRNSGKPPIS